MYSNNMVVRVNEDSQVLCVFCVITLEAYSSSDGPGQWWAEAKYK